MLLNVGPKPDGTIDDTSAERLRAIGGWLAEHGETVYGTRGGPVAPQPWGVTTQSADQAFVHVLDAPAATDGWTTLAAAAELYGTALIASGSGQKVISG